MRYVMQQKVFAFGDDFVIRDDGGNERFFVDGRVFTLRDTLSFQQIGAGGERRELAVIRQRLLSWGPTYDIEVQGRTAAVVKKKLFTLFKYRFTVDETATPDPVDLEIEGDFFDHEYRFARGGRTVAEVSKRWFGLRDTYGVDVTPGENDALILACAVVIDLATERKNPD